VVLFTGFTVFARRASPVICGFGYRYDKFFFLSFFVGLIEYIMNVNDNKYKTFALYKSPNLFLFILKLHFNFNLFDI
jgi:hypothetical protein